MSKSNSSNFSRGPKAGFAKGAPKGGQKAGSRSPGHRGFRADESAPGAKSGGPEKRWNADDRAARSADARGGSGRGSTDRRPDWTPPSERPAKAPFGSRAGRPAYGARDDRAPRWERDDRAPRSFDRDNRDSRGAGGSSVDRDNRGAGGARGAGEHGRSFDDRPRRDFSDRPSRSFDDRPKRDFNDRPARSFDDRDRGGRPARSFDDRPARSFDDRPARSFDDRPRRDFNDRPARSFDDRPKRDFNDRPARSFDDRPKRDFNDRPARSFDDRPKRDFNDRPARSFDDRPKRDFNDRPARSFDDRPKRDFNDRPARSFDDRPRRDFSDRSNDRDRSYDRPRSNDRDRDVKPSFSPQDDVVLERLEAKAVTADEIVGQSFGDLGLGDNITRQLAQQGAASPFPIQAATIPMVLAGRDVLGRGRTGSGKTIAFGAPLVERLLENNGARGRKQGRKPRALILAPTRELAMQINRTVEPIARSVGVFTTTIVGGVPQRAQVIQLQRGVDIVIATPGRVEDLVEQGRLDLSEVSISVLDEADHMCELGFLEPVQRILRLTEDGSQKLLFSATLDKGVANLVDEFLVDPSVHEVAGEDQASSTIDHRVLVIDQRDKRAIIEQLATGGGRKLVFSRTRAFAEELADMLAESGIPATALHGDLNQARRTRNLERLTSGRVNVLVATDVAARGIHVDDISLVIQADAPDEYKTYLHRAGRTGRAGRQGTVVTLTTRGRRRRVDELLGRAEIEASMHEVAPGDELLDEIAKV